MTTSSPRRFQFARDIAPAPVLPEPIQDAFTGPADLTELQAPPAAMPGREIPMVEFTEREWAIFRQGQRWGYESRQAEVDLAWNAYHQADHDADRYYRDAYDHDNHDCRIHENRGKYQGAKTRLLHWDWTDPADLDDPNGDALG